MSASALASCTLAAAVAATPGELEHQEAQLLYGSQLSFDEEQTPVLAISLMDRQEEVAVRAPEGLRVSLSGGGDATVTLPPDRPLRVRVKGGKPGETRYRVVLDGVRGGELEALEEARRTWKDRGLEVDTTELGGIVGFPGHVLDNRSVRLLEQEPYEDREAARKRAEEMMEKWMLPERPGVFAQPVDRARGTIVARVPETPIRIRQRDLLTVEGRNGEAIEVADVEHGRGYDHHGREDRRYRGRILFAVDPTAKLAVINRVSAEQLLRGLLPSETFPEAPQAALRAQAITARGELLAKIGVRHLADPFHVCSRQHCQVYSGIGEETEATDRAVEATRGQVLFGPEDHLVDSVYSASCGGHTEHNENVWTGAAHPALRGRADAASRDGVPWPEGEVPDEEQVRTFLEDPPDDAWCSETDLGAEVFRWERTYADEEMDRLVGRQHDIGHVTAIEVLERGVSGRVERVRFEGEDGEQVVESELAVRRLLDNLKSGLFVVDHDDARWRFTGGGYGHGVGMCQYGAIGMAEDGESAEAILKHYYEGASVEEVY